MNPLEVATTEELLDELRKRFAATVFAAVRSAPGEDAKDVFVIDHKGGVFTAVGLATAALDHLRDLVPTEDIDPEDMP